MAVAILQPHDCLKKHHPHRRQLFSSVNKPQPNPNPTRSNRRRRNSPPPPSNGPVRAVTQQLRPKSPPVSGQIRILKRGEEISLPSPPPSKKPEPELHSFPGPIINGFYAGSAFVTSPPPSELPLPAFFTKRSSGKFHNNEIAACELRRVLKLEAF
ncbi:anther-specific proline-rich protein APG [Spinacia oleracea]|uniref:Anther-specific proline-rich protein APG n=1 Tax=Spinacia oleracea TaxID=3562 RepID=A0A9R0K6H3_SPIOL|nr:anther-specific proline-rich protein APG [Spinacia oleracea]